MVEQRTLDTPAVRFQYAVAGDGPPVVLVPGAGGWKLSLERMITELSDGHRVFAVDPPGQGGTRVVDPVFGYDADAIARSLGDFLDAAGISATAVVGHSWGGGFALRLAQLRPDRVSRLALLAPGGLDVTDGWEFRLLRKPLIGELATRFTSMASARHILRKSFAHPDRMPGDELLRAAIGQMRSAPDAEGLRRDLLRVERGVRWSDTERDLDRVRCPTLILWGNRDRYFPVQLLARFTSRLPDLEAHTLAGCGHSLHDDCPDRVYPLLTRFLTANVDTSALHREEAHDG
ncbi:alpha/beta hydrolase [Pseudonocardia sp. DSM 110487]|uniref:alpha/beta fold hydrolase n=1 Tax=Pseudonocardia sp. DSM 110487 TaxID=2865833 RepID=UPI001C6A2A11|nr:alpha/beta hydrolase [Pseudonocardia sp. DSM 110487]QYN33664.1 alpha/beta hydrolase [Pseudonocardia sp. DSM 110487]